MLKTTVRTEIEINKSATINTPDDFVDTETTTYNTKIASVDQTALATTYTCPDCSNQVTPDHEDLVDCTCRLISAKNPCIVNDKVMVSVKNEKSIKVNLITTVGISRSCYEQIMLFAKSLLTTPINTCYNNVEMKVFSSKNSDKNKD